MITIKELARKLNLSTTAVSLVLNNKPNRLPEETRAKIREAAALYHYQPNRLALSLVTGKSHTIGLIIPDIANPFFALLVKEVVSQCDKLSYSVLLGNSEDEGRRELDLVRSFVSRNIDGIILLRAAMLNESEQRDIRELCEKNAIPVVYVDRFVEGALESTLLLNNFEGAYTATRHLISLGHRQIGCLTGPSQLENTKERLRGYRQALKDAELPFRKQLVFEGNFRLDSGANALHYFVQQNVSAIFSFNDLMAYGLYRSCRQRGIHIPTDLSIVGFDDLFLNDVMDIPLSSVEQPWEEMARDAAIHLAERIANPDIQPIRKIYKPRFVIRESTFPLAPRDNGNAD